MNKLNLKNNNGYIDGESIFGVVVFVLIIVGILVFNMITTVPTGYVGVKTRFGEVQNDTIQEGLNMKVPFIEKIVKIDCKVQIYENKKELESSTKDMQVVRNIFTAINYSVNKENANILYQKVGKKYEEILIEPAIQESVKSAFSQFTAEELITNRSTVSNLIKETLTDKLEESGINITEVAIKNFDFSEEYNQAIEAKATAQQNVEREKAELEKAKIENEKKIENARAEAEVMKVKNQETTEKSLELRELEVKEKMIEKWNGALPSTTLGDNIPMLNLK